MCTHTGNLETNSYSFRWKLFWSRLDQEPVRSKQNLGAGLNRTILIRIRDTTRKFMCVFFYLGAEESHMANC